MDGKQRMAYIKETEEGRGGDPSLYENVLYIYRYTLDPIPFAYHRPTTPSPRHPPHPAPRHPCTHAFKDHPIRLITPLHSPLLKPLTPHPPQPPPIIPSVRFYSTLHPPRLVSSRLFSSLLRTTGSGRSREKISRVKSLKSESGEGGGGNWIFKEEGFLIRLLYSPYLSLPLPLSLSFSPNSTSPL